MYTGSLFTTITFNSNINRPIVLQSSVFDVEMVKSLITNKKKRAKEKENLFESDYTRITGAILPYYFRYDQNWTISPEIWSLDKRKSDIVVSKTHLSHNGPYPFGHSYPYVMVESKKASAIS